MPSVVQTERCDGCADQPDVACRRICPQHLMQLQKQADSTGARSRAYNREPALCTECCACAKVCPRQAIRIHSHGDRLPLGGSISVRRSADTVAWEIGFRDGSSMQLEYEIRTSAEPVADRYAGKPAADLAKIAEPGFFNLRNAAEQGDAEQLIRK
jgi:adenylylsulfate reductase subunit B